MRSVLAIVTGSVFILFVVSLMGLIYIFTAVGYNKLAADFQFLHDISGIFRYLLGIPAFIVTMFAGGYITAHIANMHTNTKVLLHCLFVGFITIGGIMYPALGYSNLTLTGIIVIIFALISSTAGGLYWLRGNK